VPADDLPLWRRPQARLATLSVLLWALGAAVLALAWPVLLPFALAVLAAYVIDPVIVRLSRLGAPRRPLGRVGAVVVVYLVLALLAWALSVSVVPRVYREAMRGLLEARAFLVDLTPERIAGWAREIDGFLQRYGIPVDVLPGDGQTTGHVRVDLAAEIARALQSASASLGRSVQNVVGISQAVLAGSVRLLVFSILLFMLTAFISMDAPRILRFVPTTVPRAWRPALERLVRGIDAGLAGVVRGQITIMAVNGLLTLAGLLVLRVPFAFALAGVAALLYAIPIFGTILSTIPIVALALTRGFQVGLMALGWVLVIHALETYVLNPKIMGDHARIHPVLVVLALVVGERVAGITGALLAVPVMSVFVAVFRFLQRQLDVLDEGASAGHAATEAPPDATKGPAA
jgi:predicted PurR-regulated permease PerM